MTICFFENYFWLLTLEMLAFIHHDGKKNDLLLLVLVKSMVRLTPSQTFLDLIFLMQVTLGNEKKVFVNRPKPFIFSPMITASEQ